MYVLTLVHMHMRPQNKYREIKRFYNCIRLL